MCLLRKDDSDCFNAYYEWHKNWRSSFDTRAYFTSATIIIAVLQELRFSDDYKQFMSLN